MVERTGILSVGQSQGGKVGERALFENQTPETSVRNPAVFSRTSLVSGAATQDKFTMPGSWPSKYKIINIKGRATQGVMRLTPYNPNAAYTEMRDVGPGTSFGTQTLNVFPGYGQGRNFGTDTSRLNLTLDVAFQADPAGLTIIRERTGESLTVGAGWSSANPGRVPLASSTPLDPPLADGELFKLPMQVFATGTTTTIPSIVRFGGYHDIGSLGEAALYGGVTDTMGGFTVQAYPINSYVNNSGQPLGIRINSAKYHVGQRVQFTSSGTVLAPLAAATDYWVVEVNTSTPGQQTIYVSTTRGGDPVLSTGAAVTDNDAMAALAQHVNSTMAGCRVRFTSGALNGQEFDLTDNVESGGNFYLGTDTAMPSAPQIGDTFEILPQKIGGQDVDWPEFMHFLPECVFDGVPYGQQAPLYASYPTTSPGTPVTFTGTFAYRGARVRIYDYFDGASGSTDPVSAPATIAAATTPAPSSGSFTGAGQVLYMVNVNYSNNTFQLSTSYDGAPISDATLTAGVLTIYEDEHPDRGNPFPPGFNYDNTRAVPRAYLPYFGGKFIPSEGGATFTTSLATAMHESLGETIYVIHANVGGSSIARREATPNSLNVALPIGDYDANSMLDWSPNIEADNCYARMVRRLTAGKRAVEVQGDTLKIAGVFCLQGESDAIWAEFRTRYYQNLKALVKAIRDKIVEMGMWSGDPALIPWWQPKLPETVGAAWGGSYDNNKEINAAIDKLAAEDPFFITRATEDALISYDTIHYRGDYLFTLGRHAFDDWSGVAVQEGERTRLDICNQALKNLGETRLLASLTEDSAAARLCSRYYAIAVKSLLEAYPWQHATRTLKLTQLATNPRADYDWQYAYELPVNFLGVVSLGGDPGGVYMSEELPYSIENGVLYTNAGNDLYLRYTQSSPNPANYSQHFTNALSYQLAAEIAPGIAQGDKGVALGQSMMQMARYHIEQAQAFNAKNQRTVNPADQKYAWD